MNSLTQILQFSDQTGGDFEAFVLFLFEHWAINAKWQRDLFQAGGGDDVRNTMAPAERHQVGTLAVVFHLANQFAADFY